MDWQDQLSALRASLPEGEEREGGGEKERVEEAPAPEPAARGVLLITFEKKGRGGKQATIISGFDCPEERLREIASQIKKRLATGGSARGGEILVQGDRRKDVLAALQAMGLKAKIG